MKCDEVIGILLQHQDQLRGQFGVKSLALFGSAVRNQATVGSDVDLLVEFNRPIGLLHLIGTEQFIAQLLGDEAVDLVLKRALLPELADDILAETIDVL